MKVNAIILHSINLNVCVEMFLSYLPSSQQTMSSIAFFFFLICKENVTYIKWINKINKNEVEKLRN
jgi:uncharacterized protein (DUF2344 family)